MFRSSLMSRVLIVIALDRMKRMAETDMCECRTPPAARKLVHLAMADTAAAQRNDTTSGEHSLSAISDAMADAADAAAAAALVALPQPAAAAAGEKQLAYDDVNCCQCRECAHRVYLWAVHCCVRVFPWRRQAPAHVWTLTDSPSVSSAAAASAESSTNAATALGMHVTLAARRARGQPSTKQLLHQLQLPLSHSASVVRSPIQVSLPSLQRRQHSHDASLLPHQHIQAGNNTTHGVRSRSCGCSMRHTRSEWPLKKQQHLVPLLITDAGIAAQVCLTSNSSDYATS